MNLCSILNQSSNNIYFNWLFNVIKPYTNFMKNLKCPIEPKRFYVRKYRFSGDFLKKLPFPLGTFRILLRFNVKAFENDIFRIWMTYDFNLESYDYFVKKKKENA